MDQYTLPNLEQPVIGPSPKDLLHQVLSENFNFSGEDSTYSLHGLHSFPAKYPPQLPARFISIISEPGDLILDPMVGSGTTLLEAGLHGRRFLGFDIDPLSVIISKAKTTYIHPVTIAEISDRIIIEATRRLSFGTEDLAKYFNSRYDEKTKQFIKYWFSENNILELVALYQLIDVIDDENIRTLFQSLFSSVIITKSGGVSLARDLAHTRPHRDLTKKPKNSILEFRKKVRIVLKEMEQIEYIEKGEVRQSDARQLPIDDDSIDLIITSPPYANNAIDYIRASKFSLVWFGYSINDLSNYRAKYIGNGRIIDEGIEESSGVLRQKLTLLRKLDKKKSNEISVYFSHMKASLAEMHRSLKPGKFAIVVVASSIIRDIDIETHKCLCELGQSIGLDIVEIGSRRIDRNKRMMPARHGEAISSIEQRMYEEYILGFQKPEN